MEIATSQATATTAPKTELIALKDIRRWDDNPRRMFSETKLKELADSIRTDGVLEPILVRPAAEKAGSRFQIVAGERRWRAAALAGLTHIPAIVRSISDAKALEIAVIENEQRDNLNPVEAADGYARLMKEHHYSVEDIALKLGKSRSFVWTRLKLAGLPAMAKKAVIEERLAVSIGILIARIPHAKMQEEATKVILAGRVGRGEPMSHREAAEYIRATFMLNLAGAPFDVKDVALVPGAGACAACPKRTGSNPDLFGEFQGRDADNCTDPACYKAKADAAWKRTQASVRSGESVLPEGQARKLFNGGRIAYGAPYVELGQPCEDDARGRPWARLLGKHATRVVLARDEAGGVHRLVKRTDAVAGLKKAGVKVEARGRDAYRPNPAAKAAERKRRGLLEVLRRTTTDATAALVSNVEAQEPSVAWWRLVVGAFADGSWHDAIGTLMKRRGWAIRGKRPEESLRAQVELLAEPQLRGVLTEIVVNRFGCGGSWQTPALCKQLVRACDLFRVDLKKLQANARAAVAAKKAAKAAKKGGSNLKTTRK
jgi:ParB/RepB/Spo0J family partition protein